MVIERKNLTRIHFSDLKVGDVFVDDDDNIMLVLDKDYGLGTDEEYSGYAVRLDSGYIYGYDSDEEVIKISAKLITTEG